MKKIKEIIAPEGSVEFFGDTEKNIFLAKPHGIINPELVREDLKEAKTFALSVQGNWSYFTNTEDLDLANPFNLLYLKEVKKIPGLREIIVYAPKLYNRILLRMASFIIQPDRIVKSKAEFASLLNHAG